MLFRSPLYGFQNLDQVQAGFGQIAERWREVAARMPMHDDFLKARGMWAGAQ